MRRIICLLGVGLVAIAVLSCRTTAISEHTTRIAADRSYTTDSLALTVDTAKSAQASALQEAMDAAANGDTLLLEAGIYYASPQEFTDSLCGNCLVHTTAVSASVGFVIRGKSLTIIGAAGDSTLLVTGAGYGLYLEDCPNISVRNLAVTGGRRDKDGNATDAAIVVRRSRLYADQCSLTGNTHQLDSVVVGVGGCFGREGAEIYLSHTAIINNGWDGVALYRGAKAVISDCVIKKGRGAGIGVTWGAWCAAYRNEIAEYWKGIGSFGTSRVIAHNNLVHDNLGWGIIGTGESYLDAANNVVHHNGNCGVAPWSQESHGRFVNNIITDNGWRKEWVCPCVGVWNYGNLARWEFKNNLIWNNATGNYKDMPDLTGKDGNLAVDPMFIGNSDFHLQPGSPAIDAGYKEIMDHDGSLSDLGIYGGTSAP